MNGIVLAMRGKRMAFDGSGRELRLAARLPLSAIAKRCGVTPAAVLKWERGEREPQHAAAQLYASVLAEIQRELGRPA